MKKFTYQLPDLPPNVIPYKPKPKDAFIKVVVDSDGVDIVGDSKGLLYLAQHLIVMGLKDGDPGLHTHLDSSLGSLTRNSRRLSIYNINYCSYGIPRKNGGEGVIRCRKKIMSKTK